MIEIRELTRQTRRLEALLAGRFGASQGPLLARLNRVGRDLPAAVRRDVRVVAEAAQMAGNPKLARRLQASVVSAAFARAEAHLVSIDVADRRKGRLLSLAGTLALNMLVLASGILVVLIWRGFL